MGIFSLSLLLSTIFAFSLALRGNGGPVGGKGGDRGASCHGTPNALLASLVWVMAMDAQFLQDGIAEAGKYYTLCGMSNLPGIKGHDCDLRQIHALYK